MLNFYDLAYGCFLGVTAPYWLINPKTRRKFLNAFRQRMGHVPPRTDSSPAVLIHAVSLGEINATPALVQRLQQARPDLDVVVSVTTDTGYERGKQLYGSMPKVTLIRFPLDFTGAIVRVLDAMRPSLVVLMELELWPNFLRQCAKRHVPVVLVNGRMTLPAFKKYRMVKPVTATMLRRLAAVCAQDEVYAERFRQLGASSVTVTGTMKFDTAQVADRVNGDDQVALELGLPLIAGSGSSGVLHAKGPGLPPPAIKHPLWICGSTGPGEEPIILEAYHTLLQTFPTLRLAIIPRHPQRFNEVAALIAQRGYPLLRRSARTPASGNRPVILGDTMGELRKFYSLADIVFVGRTLVDLGPRQHGSDMIEPAALAKPVAIGPWTHNFAEAMRKLRHADAMVEVSDAASLAKAIERWLSDPPAATAVGRRAQDVVRANQGATARHAEIILSHL
jgi:3-deoxy-D-manno-octulosonic-acid transferase